MGPVTFEYLLNLIAQNRKKKEKKNPTKFIKAIAVEKPLDVASSRLWTANSYPTISKVFEIGKTTFPLFTRIAASLLANFRF